MTRTVTRSDTVITCIMACSRVAFHLDTQNYLEQKQKWWPKAGKHILAQYDEDKVVVYQAFNAAIAEYAVKNQK